LENNSNILFDDFIRKNLDSIEFPYDDNSWIKLEKDLPKKSFISNNWQKIAAITGVISAVILTSIFIHYNSGENIRTNKNKINTQNKINNSVKPDNSSVTINQTIKSKKTVNSISCLKIKESNSGMLQKN
jgi:hypothetical protein